MPEDDYPFLVALKVELNFVGKVSSSLDLMGKKKMEQCTYLGYSDPIVGWDEEASMVPKSASV